MSIKDINQAVTLLRAGGLVALPTETVYGLAADAKNETAVRKIFAAKERPYDHPLIVHIAEIAQLDEWAKDISLDAIKLGQAFWPGPLTLVLRKQPHVLDCVTGKQDTVGIRIPHHPVALALLTAFGGGLVAPSANKFTHISPTTAAAVAEELGDKVDLILDGGDCSVGVESTIVDMSGIQPIILRPGMISLEMISEVLNKPVLSIQPKAIRVPGMHQLHYAPTTKTQLLEKSQIPTFVQSLEQWELPIAIVLNSTIELPLNEQVQIISLSDDARHYAHHLYRTLRLLDSQHLKCIIIEAVPATSEWEAIKDRLSKATYKN